MDYAFGPKKNWRRWAWNRVVERLSVPPAEALVVYLAGADDFDREVALQKGFKAHNLIAVERDKKALAALRSRGVLCIHGDFLDTLYSWPAHTNVHAVIGDLCCGLDVDLAIKIGRLSLSPALRTGLANTWNFMRGRELSGFNKIFDNDWAIQGLAAEAEMPKSKAREEILHRGKLLVKALAMDMSCIRLRNAGVKMEEPEDVMAALNSHVDVHRQAMRSLCDLTNPIFNSYRSTSGQTFDSVVWKFPNVSNCGANSLPGYYAEKYRPSNQRNVAAILAHRTMRMKGLNS